MYASLTDKRKPGREEEEEEEEEGGVRAHGRLHELCVCMYIIMRLEIYMQRERARARE